MAKGMSMPSIPVAAVRNGRRLLLFFIDGDPSATAAFDSNPAFRRYTNKAKMNAHPVEKDGLLLRLPALLEPPGGMAGRRTLPGLELALAMLQCIG